MPFLPDITGGALFKDDADKQVKSVIKQVNEWGREISNENRAKIYKDEAGQNRIIIGLLPDGSHGLVISKEGVDVLDVFD